MDETDVEGISFADSYYYLIGSHGLSKKKAEFQLSRFFVYRFRVDSETGMPGFPFDDKTPAQEVERSDNLRCVIARTPELQGYAEKPLDEHGVNIEGLAVRSDRLFLGFRGPALNGKALVISVNIDTVFGNAPARLQMFPIHLGDGMGVRDLAPVTDGFLVLSGPEADEPGEVGLFFWDGQSTTPTRLGRLGGAPDQAKPEAVLVLAEDLGAYRLLILSSLDYVRRHPRRRSDGIPRLKTEPIASAKGSEQGNRIWPGSGDRGREGGRIRRMPGDWPAGTPLQGFPVVDAGRLEPAGALLPWRV